MEAKGKESEFRIPILGHIPVLGYLFKNITKEKTQTQLVIYITPHIFPVTKESKEK